MPACPLSLLASVMPQVWMASSWEPRGAQGRVDAAIVGPGEDALYSAEDLLAPFFDHSETSVAKGWEFLAQGPRTARTCTASPTTSSRTPPETNPNPS
jgi:hypothetical protein